jgi:hypothetical protein
MSPSTKNQEGIGFMNDNRISMQGSIIKGGDPRYSHTITPSIGGASAITASRNMQTQVNPNLVGGSDPHQTSESFTENKSTQGYGRNMSGIGNQTQ